MAKKDKTKFICLKHLETALIYSKLRISKFGMQIPYYYRFKTKDDERLSLNIFDEQGTFDYEEVKFVKITCPEEIIKKINKKEYKVKGCCIKESRPDKNVEVPNTIKLSALTIPINLFEIMLADNRTNESLAKECPYKLSNILYYTQSAYSIKLLDKDKKKLGYAVQLVD